jgi:hypothetical protein
MTNKSRPDSAVSSAVTFSSEALQEVIAQAVAMALEANNTKHQELFDAALAGRIIEPKGNKTERSLKNEIAVVKAFEKAGFGVVTPHVDVMTFNRWMAKGYRPMEGSKSLKIRNLRLFHKTQVRSITPEERAELEAQSAAAVARHLAEQAAKVIPIHTPS